MRERLHELIRDKAKELWIIGGLLVISVSGLFWLHGLFGVKPTKVGDLLTKIAFAILVAAVTRSLWLAFGALEEKGDLESLRSLGMLRAIEHMSDAALRERLANSGEIQVMKTWFPETDDILDGLDEAMSRPNTRLTFLLAHPDSAMLAQRSEGAGEQADEGPRRVVRALIKAAEWGRRPGVEVKVTLYDSWPACPVIWHDGKILMGFYFRGRSSTRWPWIEIKPRTVLADTLNDQFQDLESQPGNVTFSGPAEIDDWLAARANQAAGS